MSVEVDYYNWLDQWDGAEDMPDKFRKHIYLCFGSGSQDVKVGFSEFPLESIYTLDEFEQLKDRGLKKDG